MIRTNLSTRPFYNERIVHIWLLAFLRRGHRRHGVQRHAHPAVLAKRHPS